MGVASQLVSLKNVLDHCSLIFLSTLPIYGASKLSNSIIVCSNKKFVSKIVVDSYFKGWIVLSLKKYLNLLKMISRGGIRCVEVFGCHDSSLG